MACGHSFRALCGRPHVVLESRKEVGCLIEMPEYATAFIFVESEDRAVPKGAISSPLSFVLLDRLMRQFGASEK